MPRSKPPSDLARSSDELIRRAKETIAETQRILDRVRATQRAYYAARDRIIRLRDAPKPE